MHATPVDDRNFASVVRDASKERLVIVAFLERDDERLAELQLISIDRAGCFHLAAGDPRAMEHYTTALACDPSNARALLGLARLHVVRGDSSGALALATRVARDGPLGDQAEHLTEELYHHVDPEGAEAALRGRLA